MATTKGQSITMDLVSDSHSRVWCDDVPLCFRVADKSGNSVICPPVVGKC